MTYNDAVKYCEEHECTECEVYLKDLDKRTKHQKENLHYPCFVNLVDDKNFVDKIDEIRIFRRK